jgi:predicted small metal-binding protein
MQMRVIECDECGETLQAATDDELARNLGSHLQVEHDLEMGEEELTQLVEGEAYEATDS